MARVSKGKFLYLRRVYAVKEFIRKIRPKGDAIDIFAIAQRMGTRRLTANRFRIMPRKIIPVPKPMVGTPESWNAVNKIAVAICEPILQRQQLVKKNGSNQQG